MDRAQSDETGDDFDVEFDDSFAIGDKTLDPSTGKLKPESVELDEDDPLAAFAAMSDDDDLDLEFDDGDASEDVDTPDDEPEDTGDDDVDTPAAPVDQSAEAEVFVARVQAHHQIESIKRVAHADMKAAQHERDSLMLAKNAVQVVLDNERRRIIAARDDADSAAEFAAQEAYQSAQEKKRLIDQQLSQMPSADQIKQQAISQIEEIKQGYAEQVQSRQAAASSAQVTARNDLAGKFIRANSWMNNPRFSEESQAVQRISADLAQKGVDPSSAAHFRQLTQAIRKQHPHLNVADISGASKPKGKRYGAPVGNPRTSGSGEARQTKRRQKITKQDAMMIRKWGGDPRNKEHQKLWLQSNPGNEGSL